MSGERVLVVDDEPIVTEVVQRYLIREGYQVQVAADGRAALKRARENPPDLVVLDLMLPEIDGLEVCRQLRAESSIPIIMLTAKGEESDKILGLGLGADDYLTKPFSPGELIARVKAVLRRSQAAARGVRPARACGIQGPECSSTSGRLPSPRPSARSPDPAAAGTSRCRSKP